MNDSEDCEGSLVGTPDYLARLARCTTSDLLTALTSLQATGAADVSHNRNGEVTVISRRLQGLYLKRLAARNRQQRWRCHKEVTSNSNSVSSGDCSAGMGEAGEGPGRFAEFWSKYPRGSRKVNRIACEKKWNAEGLDAVADVVLAGLDRWIASVDWTKDRGAFICAPLVWLNQARWEAEPAAEETPAQRGKRIAEMVMAQRERNGQA